MKNPTIQYRISIKLRNEKPVNPPNVPPIPAKASAHDVEASKRFLTTVGDLKKINMKPSQLNNHIPDVNTLPEINVNNSNILIEVLFYFLSE